LSPPEGAWAKRTLEGWLLTVHVQPGAKRSEAAGLHGDALKVRVAAPPVEGRANAALIAFLADAFGVPKKSVTVVRGATSRRKTILVSAPHADPASLLRPPA
jgi:uncharacterized protein (TIGR00251 family)